MQAAITLDELGLQPVLIEKEATLGGKLNKWDRLFPTMTPASEVLTELTEKLRATKTEVHTSTAVGSIDEEGNGVTLADGKKIAGDAKGKSVLFKNLVFGSRLIQSQSEARAASAASGEIHADRRFFLVGKIRFQLVGSCFANRKHGCFLRNK